jgi:chromosome segregation protein
MEQMSGGEKALVGLGVIIGINSYRPSGIWILDEVDGAMDEMNIERMRGKLEGMREQTQIVMITHSKRTMSIAERLYGVTMEEAGITKVVAVRIEGEGEGEGEGER